MSSPCLLDNDAESGAESPSKNGAASLSSEALLSTGWMFTGTYVADIASETADLTPLFLDSLFKKLAQHTPVNFDHMIIFADSNISETDRVFEISIRGYVCGKRTSMSIWKAWLGQRILWTPLMNVQLSDEYIADSMRAEDLNSEWFVLGKYGQRKRFRVFCRAFYFEALLDVDIQENDNCDDCEANYILQLVRKKFMDTASVDQFQIKGAEFVMVQCDVRQLADASPGSTVSVPIQGFLQSKKTDLQTWNDCFRAEWSTAPGGLCGLEEFERAVSESSTWEPIYRFGDLKKNNNGRTAAAQASCVHSPAQYCPLLLEFFRGQCCPAAATTAKSPAPAIGLFVHRLVRRIRTSRLTS